ncbi:hypothetical protein BJ912DRAFT_1061424 [Pholiota molesta]|nr:hypothetical protein BJ912DRAFT_1061424 [Pholiota molesta]
MRKQQRSRQILRLKDQLYKGGALNHHSGRQQFLSVVDFNDNDTLSSESSFSTSDDSASTSDSAPNWSDILGADWRGSEGSISLSVPTSVNSHDDNYVPNDATYSSSSLGIVGSEDSDVVWWKMVPIMPSWMNFNSTFNLTKKIPSS